MKLFKGVDYIEVDKTVLYQEIIKSVGFDGWKVNVKKPSISITSKNFSEKIKQIIKDHGSDEGILSREKDNKLVTLRKAVNEKIREKYTRKEEFDILVAGRKNSADGKFIKYNIYVDGLKRRAEALRHEIHRAETLNELNAIGIDLK